MKVKIFSTIEEATEAIPKGGLRLLIIDGKKIAVASTEDGFKAFDNECPHQNEPLHKGSISVHNEVVCRLHHYRFNMKTGQEANNRCGSLIGYPIIVEESGVFIDL